MKAFGNYESISTETFEKLPKGAYPVTIKAAQVKTYEGSNGSFERFEIAFDINDGEYKDYFKKQYDGQTGEDKKWKGVLRLYLPKDDGSEKDEWTKRTFKRAIEAIEDSNNGYHWDWDEKKLKGKKVACIFRDEEWEYDGKSGIKAMPYAFINTVDFGKGKFKIPADKLLKKEDAPAAASTTAFAQAIEEADDDLPF